MSEGAEYQDLSGPSLLLVEDNPLHVRLVRTMIGDVWPGYENLAHVARLDHAIQHVKADPPDCVLLDLVLPDADGLEAVEAILKANPAVPIVVLSAHDDESTAADAVRSGAQDYLVKGDVTAERLSRAVRFAIERHRGTSAVPPTERRGPVTPPQQQAATAVLDVNGSVIVADPALSEMLGRNLAEIVGAPLESLAVADDVAAWRKVLDRAGGGRDSIIARFTTRDGSEVRCRVEMAALADGSGDTAAFVATYVAVEVGSAGKQQPAVSMSV